MIRGTEKDVVKRFPAIFDTDKNTVKVVVAFKPEKIIKLFKSTPTKPAVHMARESVMVHFKAYDPQVHSVTVVPRTETE